MDSPPTLAALDPMPDALSGEYLAYNRVLPLTLDDGRVRVAAAGEPAGHVIEDLELLFGRTVEVVQVDEEELKSAIRRACAASESVVELVRGMDAAGGGGGEDESSVADARDLALQPPVVRFVSLLIREAAEAGASDIHLEASRGGLRVRMRVDGVLSELPAPPRQLQAAVVSRIKLLAELDIAERRLPQDGRIRTRLDARELDLRVATVPTHFGESVTLRLLDKGGRPVALGELGMSPETLAQMEALARKRHGIVLVTGPTGSGKTTTLYAALALRDAVAEKIITVEDPVEYELPGVTQIAVDAEHGLTFARALRTVVRHDPDVIMVGEIRDEESADIAVRAAMTGHLVFSTLHTNDALSAIPRLLDLKVPAYLLAATIQGILAQRLVRRVCGKCRVGRPAEPDLVAQLTERPVPPLELQEGEGCALCRGTGFKGRTGLFELLPIDDEVRQALSRGEDLVSRRSLDTVHEMRTLKHDGWAKVLAGITTLREVLRVSHG